MSTQNGWLETESFDPANAKPHYGRAQEATGTQFGEFDETHVGSDLTIEWDSNDPDLHMHLPGNDRVVASDREDTGWNVDEAGIPDA